MLSKSGEKGIDMARCMIVDDSKFMRKIIRESLEYGGHEVVAEADNGFDALGKYKSKNPDFVTMDITMGVKDGLRAVAEITAFDPDAKIIVVSALNESTLKLAGENINARAFITKPFEREELLEVIDKVL
jgi:two-component system chemotaxis response regulator CheY